MLRSDRDPSVTVYYRYLRSMRVLFVNLAPVRNPRHTHEFCLVVDDVHDAPVTDADAPLIFVALEFFASCWPWDLGQRFDFTHDTRQHAIR
jgi:hypothetical protein